MTITIENIPYVPNTRYKNLKAKSDRMDYRVEQFNEGFNGKIELIESLLKKGKFDEIQSELDLIKSAKEKYLKVEPVIE
ncbi:hypothetical protein [Paenisporosarcina sp. NPDC076898]|uniref:hypothetical protein n=1 Tax=unclassified Paenisporosarcina TaxID=2642018 RepID=UPI003D012510